MLVTGFARLDAVDPRRRSQRLREAGDRVLGASNLFACDSDEVGR